MKLPQSSIIFILLLLSSLYSLPALAHGFKCFAAVTGDVIEGYAWFVHGDRANNARVSVRLSDGTTVYGGHTTEEGEFSFPLSVNADHVITVDGGDGYVATFTVKATDAEIDSGPSLESSKVGSLDQVELQKLIRAAVAKETLPLRQEFYAYKDARAFKDIVGAVGALLGMAGIAFFFLGVKKKG